MGASAKRSQHSSHYRYRTCTPQIYWKCGKSMIDQTEIKAVEHQCNKLKSNASVVILCSELPFFDWELLSGPFPACILAIGGVVKLPTEEAQIPLVIHILSSISN